MNHTQELKGAVLSRQWQAAPDFKQCSEMKTVPPPHQ